VVNPGGLEGKTKIRKMRQINVREYRRDNQKLKNGQSIETGNIRYTRRRQTKQIHNMCWTLLYANKQANTNNVNKT
jgi:hypothetical protein